MDILKLSKELNGLQTISSISKTLKINRKTAINYISLLRKKGYLRETRYGANKLRMYKISPLKKKKIGYPGFYELLNKYSKVKIYSPYEVDRVYDKKMDIEEVLVRAITSGDFRVILASLGLFNKIKNWTKLNYYAKKEHVGRYVGALYDIVKSIMKVKQIDKRIRNSLLNGKIKNKYLLKKIKSKDLKDIEKVWGVYLPFNKADLEVYKEW